MLASNLTNLFSAIFQVVSRSTDTLKSVTTGTTDYKKMPSNGSIESVDKSVLSSETNYDAYDQQQQQQQSYSNEYADQLKSQLGYSEGPTSNGGTDYVQNSNGNSPTKTKVYGLPDYSSHGGSTAFELAFRNEGFRDNSTTYSGVTRNNSISTAINEDTPIIHHTVENEDAGSDFYGNSSTLPMRVRGDNLSFLNELKNRLPEYAPLPPSNGHSSFHPVPMDQRSSSGTNHNNTSQLSASTLPYDQKIDRLNFSAPHEYQQPSIRRPDPPVTPSIDAREIRRPDSYMRAVKKYATPGRERESIVPPPRVDSNGSRRPKTLYEAASEEQQQHQQKPISPQKPNYARSRSEALLETNFDEALPPMATMLSSDSRSYSQPLETAM